MDDFGMLARDFGFRPQGKSAPMVSSKANIGVGSDGGDRRNRSSSSSFKDNSNRDGLLFNDVLVSSSAANDSRNKSSAGPVYDKPVYDDEVDIFESVPGLKSKSMSSSVRYDNAFSSISSPPKQRDQFDELLGDLGRTEKVELKSNKSSRGFDDLIPGFGGSSTTGSNRPISKSSQPEKPTVSANQTTSNVMEDPFVVLESTSTPSDSSKGIFTDPLEEISKLSNSGNTKMDGSSVSRGVFDDIDPLNGFGKSVPAYSSEVNNRGKDVSPSRTGLSMNNKESIRKTSFKNSEGHSQKKMPVGNFQESPRGLFDVPTALTDSHKPVGQTVSSPPFVNVHSNETNSRVDISSRSEERVEPTDDVWLTVSDIPIFTQPTIAPPPSRPPPPRPARALKSETGSYAPNARRKDNEFSSSPNSSRYSQSPKLVRPAAKSPMVSQIDELEDFAMGKAQNIDEHADVHSGDEVSANSAAAASAAAMKEAMDRAEAKFRYAKEVREREYAKAARSKEAVQLENDEESMQDVQEREFRENQERLDRERRRKEREEEERQQRRLEKEREREREREKARQAVERATREARERAAAEARLKAERSAVEKANVEARERAERAAVQRAQAEARERAAAEARERAEKAAAEARQRANAEAREKEAREKAAVAKAEAEARRRAERAAVERVAAEARERAAAAASASARMNQQKNDNDLESFFSMGSRPSSAPRPRENSSDPVLDPQFQNRGGPDESRRTSSVRASSNMRKASSTTNIVDDLTSIFGAAPVERAAKALAEKNQRDLQSQREQEERHRIAETLDSEIKRWAAGKEGNLRALLSTLQYVLWPECGWQPVSLTDLIAGASVKKVYRKATLCIHPDKVQQKGANLQQKYVAEKVFDLLKEAWNKFNSEELF
ncbi:hypothetical protein F0562_021651 [Nyssa sinensis]|uniref:J domain-containing protein n=1 Tax=Nyssa sinensis TaxID=561372 RepID=A0A5J5BKJ8_9ASTE|nr:hypothetical protein F0562_021651 [Nyssa sinensis]